MRRVLSAAGLLAALLLSGGCKSPTAGHAAAAAPAEHDPALSTATTRESSAADAAFKAHRSGVWVTDGGVVTRILRDDTKRPRHQRFVVRSPLGGTVLIAHNIDLAARIPLKKGDQVWFTGVYVWNEQGGVVHQTHRDPGGGKYSGGWIRWRDFVYR